MSAPNRASLLAKVHKVLRKHYKPAAPTSERSVLEHLLYACCLENAKPEDANEAYARIQQSFFDWNEVRVTTIAELADHLTNLPDPQAAASYLKKSLQAVFEAHFAFDLEFLRKQNLGKSEKDLERYTSQNPFLISYVVQNALGGHSIPCSRGALEGMISVGVITESEAADGRIPGAERAIPKNKGAEFSSLLHQLGADIATAPSSNRVKQILLEIDPQAKDRLPTKRKLEKPAPKRAREDKRPSDKGLTEKAVAEKPGAEKSLSEKPIKTSIDRSPTDKHAADKQAAEKQATEKHTTDKHAHEKSPHEKAAPAKAHADKTHADKTHADKPAAEKARKAGDASAKKSSAVKGRDDKNSAKRSGKPEPARSSNAKPKAATASADKERDKKAAAKKLVKKKPR
jgi:hypothetical protein